MATPAQCYYCFECLSASFKDRDPVSLATVEALWEQHEQSKKLTSLGDRAADTVGSAEEEEAENLSGLPSPVNGADQDGDSKQSSQRSSRPHGLQLPSVRRLQSQASSDSSVATTPSSASSGSNTSLFSGSTTITTPSTQSGAGSGEKPAERRYPLFVTWNTLSRSGHKSLRGCIGTFEAQDLAAGLNSYALTSAFDDSRFSPIVESLLPSLSCSLTLLSTFEPCTDAMDWVLGMHGIRISFIHRGRRYGATYLPDVAVEQGWTKEETVESLMRKAGWDGGAGGVRRLLRTGTNAGTTKAWDSVSEFRTVRYQGFKASASYAEWQGWRKWVLDLDDGQALLDSA
ncbi:hypothetical protein N7462_002440 [Penicillium macrosclerotiorum]|uniref:uncharacterized protein n=1 Tax=Penicillium macrosclerotiorum TaxID=303699 RepID=UPI0025470517|nr:uncharacterized protein N7462_002440 [Penicillium macrosclerotiorum]KAJ5693017.1 hypothetical protein N7462_002440 [Penicillium macrosclerotiorum]